MSVANLEIRRRLHSDRRILLTWNNSTVSIAGQQQIHFRVRSQATNKHLRVCIWPIKYLIWNNTDPNWTRYDESSFVNFRHDEVSLTEFFSLTAIDLWPILYFRLKMDASKKNREKLSAATAELAKSTPTPDNDAFKPKKQPRRKLQEKFVQSPIDVSFSNLRKT